MISWWWIVPAATVGLLLGAYFFRYLSARFAIKRLDRLNHRYFKGLNYLLNDESDKAIDVFIKLAETSRETFEPQLALGNLYRRKGEVDRAIRLHQSLIAQPDLPQQYRTRALLAIGKDYMSAGLLDRAEVLFSELVEIEAHTPEALKALNDIYQQEQDWPEAIRVASRYEATSGRSMTDNISHYYCEMADHALLQQEYEEARKHLNAARRIDPKSVRASLSFAGMYEAQEQWQQAIDSYKQAIEYDDSYVPEFIDQLVTAYKNLDKEKELEAFLLELMQDYQGISPILALAEIYSQTQSNSVAADFIEKQLKERASVKGLNALIELNLSQMKPEQQEASYFLVLRNLVDKLLANKPKLRCRKCGFGAQSLHWQCPSCRSWGTVKPIYGLESE